MINDNAWLTLRKDADDGLDTKVAFNNGPLIFTFKFTIFSIY